MQPLIPKLSGNLFMWLNRLGLVYLPFCWPLLVAGYPATDNTAAPDAGRDKEPRCAAAKADGFTPSDR